MLERALTLAEPEGLMRIFLDEGPPMARLLHQAAARGVVPEYVARLLAAFEMADDRRPTTDRELPASSLAHRPSSALVEPLSERELEVLQLVAEGLTNQEIASRLYLSLNTVKVHTRNIYGKLDVHSRTQAIARSQELGLLPRL
jgi:LuxR family maltose regulon positive regulatory protein